MSELWKGDALEDHSQETVCLVPEDPVHLDLSLLVDVLAHLALPAEHLNHADDA